MCIAESEIVDALADAGPVELDSEDIEISGPIIWNYYLVAGVQNRKGGAKNHTCTFCDTSFTGCNSSRAYAHIVGRKVLDQTKMGIKACIPIRKKDDDRYPQFLSAKKILIADIMAKEAKLSTSKTKQSVLDLTTPGKRSATGELKILESKILDSNIANFFYENALSFNVADSKSFAIMVEQCIEFGQQNPGRKYKAPLRSAHGHIHSEVRNRLAPATTEKLVYVYSNRKAAAAACDDELKMFSWDNEEQ